LLVIKNLVSESPLKNGFNMNVKYPTFVNSDGQRISVNPLQVQYVSSMHVDHEAESANATHIVFNDQSSVTVTVKHEDVVKALSEIIS